jgi:tRNA (guanine37-N1)-methyltransferase
MKFDVLTIFPEIISSYASQSILGRGQKSGHIQIEAHDFRKFSSDKRGHVDDTPYGGGPGMVLQVQPIFDCLKKLGVVSEGKNGKPKKNKIKNTKVIIMDPAGKKFDQKMAQKYAKLENLILIAGRYEGFDARIYKLADERVSVGDYVLAGGELAALTIIEAASRLIPGVLGNAESLKEETFEKNQKEYPQYTRPENFMGLKVPEVLLSGDHKKIENWRQAHTGNEEDK